MIRYTLYYHLSPLAEFSHGAFFLLELLKVNFRRFFKLQLQLQKGCKKIKQNKLLTQKVIVRIFKEQANILAERI
jgi:hypothetical protein